MAISACSEPAGKFLPETTDAFEASRAKFEEVVAQIEAPAFPLCDFLCPFNVLDRKTSHLKDFNPPTPTNTTASCLQDLIDFYSYYFKSRNIITNANPIASTIRASCNGKDVPQSGTNGYTYNAMDHYFTLRGNGWADVSGATCSVEFI